MSQTIKDQLIEMMQRLPDDVSFEEIMYHFYVKETILQRMKDSETNPSLYLSDKEVEEEINKWFR